MWHFTSPIWCCSLLGSAPGRLVSCVVGLPWVWGPWVWAAAAPGTTLDASAQGPHLPADLLTQKPTGSAQQSLGGLAPGFHTHQSWRIAIRTERIGLRNNVEDISVWRLGPAWPRAQRVIYLRLSPLAFPLLTRTCELLLSNNIF